jgi:hypothetical protein
MKVADGMDLGQHECSDERRLELEDRQNSGWNTEYGNRESLQFRKYRFRKKA